MELQNRVTALEEEVGILKGEIKAILQEVRVAVLARQNPFMDNSTDAPPSFAAIPPASSPVEHQEPAAAPPSTSPSPTPLRVVSHDDPVEELWMQDPEPASIVQSASTRPGTRPLDLAALLTWVQDVSSRLSEADFAILLSIGAYGGMIDDDLKDTLLELAQNLTSDETHRATLPEFTLALQQLEALQASAPGKPESRRRIA